jgi:hypothetical protein
MSALPFATVAWRSGNSTFSYRMASAPSASSQDESEAAFYLPRLSMRDGQLALERGLHQEIGWERRTDALGMAFLVYSDHLENPVIEARGSVSAATNAVLSDPMSGLMRAAGPNFSTSGIVATVEHRLPHGNHVRVSYANGDALVMPAAAHATALAQLFSAARPRHTQMYAISLSGTLDGSGTRWRASYRWQPADTVTPAAPYALGAVEPYLNLHIRQPICLHRDGMRIDALLDMKNMLAEGYRPYLLNGGSLLVFAQDQRSVGAGLAFTF